MFWVAKQEKIANIVGWRAKTIPHKTAILKESLSELPLRQHRFWVMWKTCDTPQVR
jgi:hypothetical protein